MKWIFAGLTAFALVGTVALLLATVFRSLDYQSTGPRRSIEDRRPPMKDQSRVATTLDQEER